MGDNIGSGGGWIPPAPEHQHKPHRADEPAPTDPDKKVDLQVQADGVGEWIGGLIVLCLVVTMCLLVLHWAGVL